MHTWNCRVVRRQHSSVDSHTKKEHIDYSYGIHEARYDKEGHVGAITQDPVEPKFFRTHNDTSTGNIRQPIFFYSNHVWPDCFTGRMVGRKK